MNILAYEDRNVERLYPITLARPAIAITCACLRLSDWLASLDANVTSSVRPYLRELQRLDFPFLTSRLDAGSEMTLLLNATVVPCVANFGKLESLIQQLPLQSNAESRAVAVDQAGDICAIACPTQILSSLSEDAIAQAIAEQAALVDTAKASCQLDVLRYPHDVIRFNQEHFTANLEHLINQREFEQLQDGVFIGADVKMDPLVHFDTKEGPIVIDDGGKVGPFTHIAGPVYSGKHCTILEHSSIKDYVCLTHTVKAGGEIEASVIEPYSNKQHHGFLGHSYLGSWINLGAGTCNSDLKNTYGKVNCNYGGEKVSTDMQFVGCFIGDYSKTAINTSIFTGKSIGVGSMLYGFVAADVPSFVNYAKTFDQITEVPPEVMVTTQKRMFGRRKVEQRPADMQLLNDLFAMTQSGRDNQAVAQGNLKL